MSEQKPVQLKVNTPFPQTGLPPALAANHFWVFYLTGDVEIVFGFADVPTAAQLQDEAVKKGHTEFTVTPEPVSRIFMSANAFPFFARQVASVAKQLGVDLEPQQG